VVVAQRGGTPLPGYPLMIMMLIIKRGAVRATEILLKTELNLHIIHPNNSIVAVIMVTIISIHSCSNSSKVL
jgi:hypothetical protein